MIAFATCDLDIQILVMCAGLSAKLDIFVSMLYTCKTFSSSSVNFYIVGSGSLFLAVSFLHRWVIAGFLGLGFLCY